MKKLVLTLLPIVAFIFSACGGDNVRTDTSSEVVDEKITQVVQEKVVREESEFEPMVTFTFDDGFNTDYEVVYPMFESKGIKGCSAIHTNWIEEKDNRMSWDEIRELEANGWEILSHTMGHMNLTEVDEATIRSELEGSLGKLIEEGLTVKNLAYPYNANNALARSVASEFYRSARARTGTINDLPLDGDYLYRLSSQRMDPGDDLQARKDRVDEALAENKWLIFYIHEVVQDSNHYNDIVELIDYIQTKGLRVVTIDQGLDILGLP